MIYEGELLKKFPLTPSKLQIAQAHAPARIFYLKYPRRYSTI